MKYSVITFVFNNYDILRDPLDISFDCEYIAVTDNRDLKSDIWTIKYLPDWLSNANGITKSFYVRYHPFEFVTTNTCIVIDGSILIKRNLDKIINEFNARNSDICLSVNCTVNNSYNEFPYWIARRHYPSEQMHKSIALMELLNYPKWYKGCFEATFKICRRNKQTDILHNFIYSCLELLGDKYHVERLDQTILTALMNTKFNHLNVMPVSRDLYQSSYLQWCAHNSRKPYTNSIPNTSHLFMFNKPCNVYHIE